MDVNKILSSDLLDLVFEDRNKAYGAYDLRRTYKKRLTIALMCTAAVALLADRKSTRLNSSHLRLSRMPSSA